jgi:hypothetical protein
VVNSRQQIANTIKVFDRYPPNTSRLVAQLKFMREMLALERTGIKPRALVRSYLELRSAKFAVGVTARPLTLFTEQPHFSAWLSGFTEAEGCFCVRASGRCSFSIGQKHDSDILLAIRAYIGTKANVIERLSAPGFFCFETYNMASLRFLIRHFTAHPLLGEKGEQLKVFLPHVTPASLDLN